MSSHLFIALAKAGLGLPDTEAWNMIETIAEKQKLGYKLLVNWAFCLFRFAVIEMSHILCTLYSIRVQFQVFFGNPNLLRPYHFCCILNFVSD